MKILLMGGPIDGKIVNIPNEDVMRQSWSIRLPNPSNEFNNWNNTLTSLYKIRIVDDKIQESKSFNAIIFDYCGNQ